MLSPDAGKAGFKDERIVRAPSLAGARVGSHFGIPFGIPISKGAAARGELKEGAVLRCKMQQGETLVEVGSIHGAEPHLLWLDPQGRLWWDPKYPQGGPRLPSGAGGSQCCSGHPEHPVPVPPAAGSTILHQPQEPCSALPGHIPAAGLEGEGISGA